MHSPNKVEDNPSDITEFSEERLILQGQIIALFLGKPDTIKIGGRTTYGYSYIDNLVKISYEDREDGFTLLEIYANLRPKSKNSWWEPILIRNERGFLCNEDILLSESFSHIHHLLLSLKNKST